MSRILIVGAGPTGLILALWLARMGVKARVIDKADAPGKTSRAMAVQARTLEFYDQLGIADGVVNGGIKMDSIQMRTGGRTVFRVPLGDFGAGLSPHPYVVSFPQDDHERLLLGHLERAGVSVERQTELTELTQTETGVRATLQTPHGAETVEAEYVCGCDGARSAVRHQLGISFPGGTYGQVFFVADARARGEAASGSVTPCLDRNGFTLVMPVRSSGTVRLIGIVPEAHEKKDGITWDDVAPDVLRVTGLKVDKVHWFSTYHVHHRVADSFRRGRVFLSGDAAHIHSPAGGQGMNTGIGDAINLAWKLGAVVQGKASPLLLDTYEPERIAFARVLISTTDWLFQFIASRSWPGWLVRGVMLPRVAPLAVRFQAVQRFLFRAVSQIRIAYRDSRLSSGSAGQIHGGDRLPWVRDEFGDNFAPLRSRDWQVHVYGTAGAEVRDTARRHGLALHEFPANAELARDAAYLIRPDGYVAWAGQQSAVARLERFLGDWEIQPR